MSNILEFFKYRLSVSWKAIAQFYVVILGIYIISVFIGGRSLIEINGVSFIFLFVVGLNIFKTEFLFAQANNISRCSFYLATALTIISLGFVVGLTDHLLSFFIGGNTIYRGLLYTVYPASLPRFFAQVAFNIFVMLAGWLITMLYYRASSLFKVIISLAPIIIIWIFNKINAMIGGGLWQKIFNFLCKILGFGGEAPNVLPALLSFTVFSLFILVINSLLMSRMPIKAR